MISNGVKHSSTESSSFVRKGLNVRKKKVFNLLKERLKTFRSTKLPQWCRFSNELNLMQSHKFNGRKEIIENQYVY